ncbi:uncharacterized protein LOC127413367 isoform X5 [Myxocyprinus asiaticus]|uniref:uncharacterized protein LOC127413367 isoform X3 n=1 Tax=Myxocyprinus asiaticus TaxID=70543 RepID=UPI0022238B66|nr:uncharacterized protein LOC127413367 isoform X3 [Myxocyprinus asiaticus]XP_051506430.1 uncharacterized protein LOC127413367 isoform X4 [Myxocyprinus asiaticus]XP_051506431.1 uncharacterized protein LOC127413367 isoform X5 [Myxocyprinus asiaticus]
MADKCHIYLLGLIILCSPLTGTSEVEDIHVFFTDGENVTLPCNNARSDCTSTTWNYYGEGYSEPEVLISGEIKKNGIERHERLNLGSDCSLNIYKTTKEDYGLYNCWKYVNGERPNTENVYLHFLQVSPPSTQTEIRPGSSVTLSCQLYLNDKYTLHNRGFKLVWVNESGVDLQTDSRYQISSSPEHCNITLTTTLLNEDNDREWRCQITEGTDVKTSVSYTVKYLDTSDRWLYKVIPAVTVAVVALLTLVILWLICKRRADRNEKAQDPQGSDKRSDASVCETINSFIPPAVDVHEKTDDVSYAEVITYRKSPNESQNVHSDDKVTYAAIREAKGVQENCSATYASVIKNPPKLGPG